MIRFNYLRYASLSSMLVNVADTARLPDASAGNELRILQFSDITRFCTVKYVDTRLRPAVQGGTLIIVRLSIAVFLWYSTYFSGHLTTL